MPRRRRSPSPLGLTTGTGPCFLELSAIGKAARLQSRSALTAFTTLYAAMSLDWSPPESRDELLVFWSDRAYFMGQKVNGGTTLLAALQHLLPAPSAGITYLRPKETARLRVNQRVPPALLLGPGAATWGVLVSPASLGVPGKTGHYDESVVLDIHTWLHPPLMMLVATRSRTDLLFSREPGWTRARFSEVCDRVGLGPWQPCLYGFRHGGASHNLLMRHQSVAEVKKRGHWASDRSLRRYGKESLVMQKTNRIPRATLLYGLHIEAELVTVFHAAPSVASPAPASGRTGDALSVRRRPATRRGSPSGRSSGGSAPASGRRPGCPPSPRDRSFWSCSPVRGTSASRCAAKGSAC